MSITRVQGNTAQNGGGTTQAITLGVGVTLGNLLIVAVSAGSNNVSITAPDASWTQVVLNQPAGSNATIETSLWYLVVDAGHAGATSWTWTISTTHSMFLTMEEWSASTGWPVNPVDGSALGDTAGSPTQSTTIQSGTTMTTTQAEELWVASLAYKGAAQTETAITSGWTKDVEATNSANTMTMLYQIASATGAASVSYTIGTAKYWAGCVVTFKDNAAVAQPALGALPPSLSFSAQAGGASPASQTETLSETAGNATAWTSSISYGTLQPSGWLALSPTSGSLAGNGSTTITLSCTTGSLNPGTYTATVTFTATTGGSTATVMVTFGVTSIGTQVYIGGYRVQNVGTTLTAKRMVGKRGELATTVYDPNSLTQLYSGRALGSTLTQNALLVHFQQYQRIAVFADGQSMPSFSGYLTSPVESKPGFQALLTTQLTAIDQHYLADKRIVATVYRNQTCGFIVQDIVTNILAAEGVTVGQIAPGAVVPIANFGYIPVSQALDALVVAASASGVPHYWMIDANKQIWFVSYAAVVGPAVDGTQIDDGRLSGFTPTLTRANPNYRNWQYAVGGVQQTGTNDETRKGDGTTRTFTYSFQLAAAPSIFTLNGVTKTLGLKGQSGFQYYYAVGDNTIAQDTGQVVLATTDSLRMVYVGQVPAVFQNKNSAQITTQAALDGTSGINEAVLTDNTITTASDGNAKVNAQLSQYSLPGQLFQFATLDNSFVPGQLRAITYGPLGFFNTQMLISEVDTSDQTDGLNLWNTVSAVIGPYDVTWVEFFSRLFKKNAIAASISLGITLPSHLAPSKTLAPSTTLAPG